MRIARKAAFLRFTAACLILLAAHAVRGDTEVSGPISTDTTWTLEGSPYIVVGDVTVRGVGTPILTIEPGVTVRFNAGRTLFVGSNGPGGLQAVGTAGESITFTANTATPTAGFWQGLLLHSQTAADSRIAYATVRYAGSSNIGGVEIQGCSPTIENVTIQTNSFDGIRVDGGSPVITDTTILSSRWGLVAFNGGSPTVSGSTFSSNRQDGLWVSAPSSLSLESVTISDNLGFAMTVDAAVTLGAVSDLTVTGNGTNGIEVRGSTVGEDATWKSIGIPYIVTADILVQRSIPPVPTLTIEPGVTVRFNASRRLLVGFNFPGGLNAAGTAAQPITFTANTATPTPGFWRGIGFFANTTASSQIAYARVGYGGVAGSWGGIHVVGASPTFDHVTLESNAYAGLSANGSASVVQNCHFANNAAGILNQTPASGVAAPLNWWGSWDGPSGEGYGSGESVSAGVSFEPWLIFGPSHPHFFDSFSHENRTFNPSMGVYTTLTFGTSQEGDWAVTILDSMGLPVRVFTGSGSTGNPTWDGTDELGEDAPDGVYLYFIESMTATDTATPLLGYTILDRSS